MAKRGRPKKSDAEKSPITKAYESALKNCNSGFKYILDNYDPLTREEEKICSETDLVLHNFRYMFRTFKKYLVNIPLPEYCSEIYAALYDAASRFDRNKNMKFITYAQSYVNLYLLNYARRQENIISFNPSAINKIKTIQKFMYNFESTYGRPVTKEDVIKKFKMTEKLYEQYMYYCKSFLVDSLNEAIGQDKSHSSMQERTRADIISPRDVVDMDEESFVETVEKTELYNLIKKYLQQFPDIQQKILKAVYIENESIRSIAKSLNISTKKCEKLKDEAISRLRVMLLDCAM